MLGWTWIRAVLLAAIGSIALSSCAKLAGTEAVSVTAINYTDQELNSYLFKSVDDPVKVAGGPPVGPYEGAGTMCCFSLPAKWHPGIKVQLTYDWWNGSESNRQHITKVLEVPKYPDGQVGTLWALFYPKGEVEVVSSEFAPGHPKWPGRVKGWPKPSLEYKRKLWQTDYQELLGMEKTFTASANASTAQEFLERWSFYQKFSREEVAAFSGPEDPAFRKFATDVSRKDLIELRERMTQMEANKP